MEWSAPSAVRAFTLKARFKKEVAMTIATLGIDLATSVFHLVGEDAQGRTVLRRRMTRRRLIILTATLPACRIGMEACCGAHYLGRIVAGQGHDVRLMPAQYVRPFVKSHKNDYVDAEAIAEAVQRPSMHFVPLKSEVQLD
jgi:transposase